MAFDKRIIEELEAYIDSNIEFSLDVKEDLKKALRRQSQQVMNIMVTGATGCGKSSTINALFETEKAKVGSQTCSETIGIAKYELDNLVIWDTPGLGDDLNEDEYYSNVIANHLNTRDSQNPGRFLIDLVLVILDGSTRDFGTSYKLINDVIIPNLGDNESSRILVAINQADVALKGRHWNAEHNLPEPPLVDFLEQKVKTVKERIYGSTGVDVDPIYYSAGYTEPGKPQEPGYNIAKLLYYILSKDPAEKRLFVYREVNPPSVDRSSNDNKDDYTREIEKTVCEGARSQEIENEPKGPSLMENSEDPLGAAIGGLLSGIGGRFLGK